MVKHSPAHAKTHRGVELFEAYVAEEKEKSPFNKIALNLFVTVILKQWKDNHGVID